MILKSIFKAQNRYIVLTSFYIILVWCSFINAFLPSLTLAAGSIAVVLLTCYFYPTYVFVNSSFIWCCVYLLMMALVIQIHPLAGLGYGSGNYDTFIIESAFLLPSISLGAVLLNLDDRRTPRCLFWIFVISVGLSLINIIPVMISGEISARDISYDLGEDTTLDDSELLIKKGFWDYVTFHAIALPFAMIVGLVLHTQGRIKEASILLALSILFIVANIHISTTFIYIISVIIVLCFLQWRDHTFLLILLALTFFIIFSVFINDILYWLASVYDGTSMEEKILDFIDISEGGNGYHGSIDARKDFQQDNYNAFLSSPLWGEYYEGGGHSIIWTRLGSGGLLCGIPFIMMLYSIFKNWYDRIPSSSKIYYILSWIGAFILLYNKGVFGSPGYSVICIILPSLALLYNYQGSNKKIDSYNVNLQR